MAGHLHVAVGPEPSVERRAALPASPGSFSGTSADALEPGEDISPECVKWLLRGRQQRASYFAADLFADPAWDIMLDLFEAELEQRRVSISSACIGARVPTTTGLRWLRTLEENGLVSRREDPLDRRRIFVELTPAASTALRRWFAATFAARRRA